MNRKLYITGILLFLLLVSSFGQVRIRLFSALDPGTAVFSVAGGIYEVNGFNGNTFELSQGEIILISKFNDRLAVKARNERAVICDSVFFLQKTGNDSFTLRVNGIRQLYSGDLQCFRGLGTILLINVCDIDPYISGVVRAEGGSGKNIEYFKTQAVIVRTYMYKYFDKHITDRFNLCDNTHCQAFNGVTNDTTIVRAASETKGQVILGPDSALIISAFHSNCGGETSPSENVWLASQTYLKKVTDPFCTSSRNAKWQTAISLEEWTDYLKSAGYSGDEGNSSLLNFSQKTRLKDYKAGDFTMPLNQIRTDLKLRSTFFSLSVAADSVVFNGRGYGHGVGLCQEGAMVMAIKGFDYKQIIGFYFTGVFIADIKDAVAPEDPLALP
jgi:stage II sporulation protein D